MSRNNGLELFVKAAKRAASCGVQRDCSFSEAVRMAPMGKPEVKPNATANPASPGRRNKGRITGSKSTPKKRTKPKESNKSAAMKKGSSEGKRWVIQVSRPRHAPS